MGRKSATDAREDVVELGARRAEEVGRDEEDEEDNCLPIELPVSSDCIDDVYVLMGAAACCCDDGADDDRCCGCEVAAQANNRSTHCNSVNFTRKLANSFAFVVASSE
jgi:hypothetical protein